MNARDRTAIEPGRFRQALGHFASGITVITSHLDGEPIGFTCSAFYSVSMHPPLVSFSVKASSFSYPRIRQAGRFAVNILSADQADVSSRFAQQGADKWSAVDWRASPLGNPVIADSLHWLDCAIHAEHVAGDHLIVVGEVKALGEPEVAAVQPLLYCRSQG
ncbi:flavin reductase family protein [Sphaerotilus sp.]|uniref:flavin reductase family protein n=1 Tax=Sphaerotilus sp. TaxID=2093942 RepID=UPI002ACD1FB7|nr:flavin reductase family protein [Sphaerotilus sp.]MDZ7855492.1 flavin reductase family protein [Sphaerotilus sp.]